MKELSLYIIQKHFGDTFRLLVDKIGDNPDTPISQIIHLSELEEEQARHCLAILIKTGMLQYSLSTQKQSQVLNINYDTIINFSRIPKILKYFESTFGQLSMYLVETIILNGSLSASSLIQNTQIFLEQAGDLIEHEYDEQDLKDKLIELVKFEYLVVCPKVVESSQYLQYMNKEGHEVLGKREQSDQALQDQENNESNIKKQNKPRISKNSKLLKDDMNNSLIGLLQQDTEDKEVIDPFKTNNENTNNLDNPSETLIQPSQDQYLLKNKNTGEEYVFRINFKKIVHSFRSQKIARIAEERLDPMCSMILQAVLNKSSLHGRAHEIKLSEAFNLNDIIQVLPNSSQRGIDPKKLQNYLDMLVKDSTGFLKKSQGNSSSFGQTSSYQVNLDKVVYMMKLKCVENLILKKYNAKYLRVFRCMQVLQTVTEKQIEEVCLLNLKDARKVIYELQMEGLLEQVEINANQNVFCYKLRTQQFIMKYGAQIIKMKFNFLRKIDQLQKQVEEQKRLEMMGTSTGNLVIQKCLSDLQKFEIACCELDDVLMLFTSF